jgi:hypothetical protein
VHARRKDPYYLPIIHASQRIAIHSWAPHLNWWAIHLDRLSNLVLLDNWWTMVKWRFSGILSLKFWAHHTKRNASSDHHVNALCSQRAKIPTYFPSCSVPYATDSTSLWTFSLVNIMSQSRWGAWRLGACAGPPSCDWLKAPNSTLLAVKDAD